MATIPSVPSDDAGEPGAGPSLSLTVLGCDGSWTGPGGAASGYLVASGATNLLMDAGPGTFARLQQHLDPALLDAVFISHHHPDHWTDLHSLATHARFVLSRTDLPVYAPADLVERIQLRDSPAFDWRPVSDGGATHVGDLDLHFHRTDHAFETLAVRIDSGDGALGYSADTGPDWSLAELGAGLHLVLCEATYTIEHEGIAGHMSGRQAGGQSATCWYRAPGDHPSVADGRRLSGCIGGSVVIWSPGGTGSDRKGIRTVSEGAIARRTTDRADGRATDELRPAVFERDFTVFAPGSVLVSMGRTRVLCTASVEERVPPWMRGSGKGWVTAEYSLLPGSTGERVSREAAKGKQSGRTQEIQRLIGRSLRSVCDMAVLGELQITVDCDVLQADGGTRTASICGAYVALHDALTRLIQKGALRANPLTEAVAAVSVGVVDGVCMLDLPYEEDSRAEVDMNVVMTSSGRFIEVQGTAEGMPFTKGELDEMLSLAEHGIAQLLDLQAETLAEPPSPR